MPDRDLTLGDVVAATGGELRGLGRPELPLSGVAHDSRRLRPGELFVALRGPQHDGHTFVADAFARGAAAALVERVPADVVAGEREGPSLVVAPSTPAALRALAAAWRARQPAEVVLVSGSIGRGTTAELCAAVLRQRYETARAAAAARTEVSLPLALLGLRGNVARLIVEVAPSDESQVEALVELARPCATVVTSLQAVHLEDAEAVDRRAGLIDALLAGLPDGATAALNADEPRVRALVVPHPARAIRFGLDDGADVRAEAVLGHGVHGTIFDLVVGQRRVHVRLPLLGLFALHGALAGAALGAAAGLELREIGAGLQTASHEPRIIAATGINGSRVVDESTNASPESGLEALNMLAGLGGRRRIAVLGDMLNLGRQEIAGHHKVGNRAASVVHGLVTVGERATLIADEARRMGLGPEAVYEARTNEDAVEYLRHRLQPGDLVLVKGARELRMERIVEAIRVEG